MFVSNCLSINENGNLVIGGANTLDLVKDYKTPLYVTFMTSVFRSIRFGASSAHGRANPVRFNFFLVITSYSIHYTKLYDGNWYVKAEFITTFACSGGRKSWSGQPAPRRRSKRSSS